MASERKVVASAAPTPPSAPGSSSLNLHMSQRRPISLPVAPCSCFFFRSKQAFQPSTLPRVLRASNAAAPTSILARGLASQADPYDVVVIGGGPGGYVAAIKAAQQGLKVSPPQRPARTQVARGLTLFYFVDRLH